jgi:hypothetical protein
VTNVTDVERLAPAGHDALQIQEILRPARHTLVDGEILGRAESHGAGRSYLVVDGARDRVFLEVGQRRGQ